MRLTPLSANKVIKILEKIGFQKVRQKGSHVFLKHPDGAKYGKPIKDSYEEIDCPYYLEKGFAGAMSPAFDDEFFDMF